MIDYDFSEVVARRLVLRTDPGPLPAVDKGGTVGLILSSGPERYPVPDCRRPHRGLRSHTTRPPHGRQRHERGSASKVDAGSVISTDPGPAPR